MKEELKEGVSSSESVTGPTGGCERQGWERQEQEGCRLSTSLLRCFTVTAEARKFTQVLEVTGAV